MAGVSSAAAGAEKHGRVCARGSRESSSGIGIGKATEAAARASVCGFCSVDCTRADSVPAHFLRAAVAEDGWQQRCRLDSDMRRDADCSMHRVWEEARTAQRWDLMSGVWEQY